MRAVNQCENLEFIHSLFITEIYIAPLQDYYSEALPTPARLKRSFEAIVKCVRKNPEEQSLRQRKPIPHRGGQPPGLWRYEQKEQRVTPVPMSGVNCDLWCPGLDSKDLGGRP